MRAIKLLLWPTCCRIQMKQEITYIIHLESHVVFLLWHLMVLLLAVQLMKSEQFNEKHSSKRDLPQLCHGLGDSSFTLAVWQSLARHCQRHISWGWLKLIRGTSGTIVFIVTDWCWKGIYICKMPIMSGKPGWNCTLKYTGRVVWHWRPDGGWQK